MLDERGRFSSEYSGTKENPNPNYRGRYFKDSIFDALDVLKDACAAANIPMADAAMRWCKHHVSTRNGLGRHGPAMKVV